MAKTLPLAGAAALLLALPLTAQTAPQKPGAPDPSRITGGTYQADPFHTVVTWEVDHLGFSPLPGLFGDITGTLVLDPKNPAAARVDVTIPIAKVATSTGQFTGHFLRPGKDGGKPDLFGANPAPARFVSTKVEVHGKDHAMVTGDLTLMGVTKSVVLDTRFYGAGKAPPFMGGKENVGFAATTTLKRSEFGIGYGVPMVSDEVSLKIDAAFAK